MKVVSSPAAAARLRHGFSGRTVLVPTMGALHRGHFSLVRRARKLAGSHGVVIVSIFVNPVQFGPGEDFTKYPRPFSRDRKACEDEGVDLLFHPQAQEMYPDGYSTYVDEHVLSTGLCGASRPGHFRGVCTVVLKLFNILQPDIAVFGEKDYQQLAVLRRMVRDLNLPIRLVGSPIVRELDGLALSSRNAYLSQEERKDAPLLRKALVAAASAAKAGTRGAASLRRIVRDTLGSSAHARIDYIEVVDADSLAPLKTVRGRTVIAAAVFFGRTRLIDNIRI